MKLHRKIKLYEKLCRAHGLGSNAQGQGHNQVRGQNPVSEITKRSTEANLTKLHRQMKHTEKVYRAHKLGSYAQSQGHSQVRGQIVPKIVLLINY